MVGPLALVTANSPLRIATLVPYFDNYVRLNNGYALMGFGMHPLETRFKRAHTAAYGRPVSWDYYNCPHRPIYLPFLNNFSVGYFLNMDSRNFFLGDTTRLLPPGSPVLYVHTKPGALPRAFTLDRVVVASEEEQLSQLVSGDLRRAVYMSSPGCFRSREPDMDEEEDPALHFMSLQQANHILRLDLDDPNRIDLDIEVNKPAMLVLTEVWYPGWQASVDGQSATIYRVNYCQRGVWLEKGKHCVGFWFRPVAWQWGLGISLGTMGLMACLLGVSQVRKIMRNKHLS